MFFMPLSTQSAKITFMPVAERLVQLGHKVTLVTPYHSDVKIDGEYYDVVINSDYIRQRLKEHSDNMWTETSIVDKLKLAVHWWTSKIVPSEEVSNYDCGYNHKDRPENTHSLCNKNNNCMADLLFDWIGFN